MRVFPETARRGDLRMRRAGAVTIHPNRTARSRTDTPSMTEIPGQTPFPHFSGVISVPLGGVADRGSGAGGVGGGGHVEQVEELRLYRCELRFEGLHGVSVA